MTTLKQLVEAYAERNGELHVLCHEALEELERVGSSQELVHKLRERLHNVPQCRRNPVDE